MKINFDLFYSSIHNLGWRFWLWLRDFCHILYLLEYESRMRKLLDWARRKRLQGVASHYQDRLIAIETELMTCRWRRRHMVVCCEFLHTAHKQIWPDKPPASKQYHRGRRRRSKK